MKTWTYDEITRTAELEIKDLMDRARAEQYSDARRLYRQNAYGAYLLWHMLTSGNQRKGDNERLEALTKSEPLN